MRRLGGLVLAAALAWWPLAAAAHEDEKNRTPALVDAEGEPLTFTDHRGRTSTEESFLGQFLLIYFGYTHCPDVCPTDLQVITHAVEDLGEAGGRVTPIFITVDPERDTVEVLADYVEAFHPRLIGLTGTAKQIAAVAKVYGAGYMKLSIPVPDEDGEGAGDYGMGHSATLYLVALDGRILTTYPRGITPEHLAADLRRFLEAGA